MKQKYWKLLLAIVVLLATVVLLCADVIPRKNGSLLHIYDIDDETLASCMLYEADGLSQRVARDSASCEAAAFGT